MKDRMFLNKLNRFLASHGSYQGPITPGGITEMGGGGGGGGGGGFVTPSAITDIADGREDMTVTPGAITDMAGGGGGSVAPNSITDIAGATAPNTITNLPQANRCAHSDSEHGIGATERDVL